MAIQIKRPRVRENVFKFLPAIFAACFIGAGGLIISVWSAHQANHPFRWIPQVNDRYFYLGLFAGMGLTLALIPFAARGPARYVMPFTQAARSWAFPLTMVAACVLVVGCIGVAQMLDPMPNVDGLTSFFKRANANPGGWFVIVTGIATLLALWYTWHGLTEIRRTIASFSDLVDRVCAMAEAHARPENPLRILAYTPAVGFLAQPMRDWNRLYDVLSRKPDGKPIVEVVCLRGEDLAVWHSLFVGRRTLKGTVTQDQAAQATSAAEALLETIAKDNLGRAVEAAPIHRLPWRFMPGFYLFFTRERAIVVTPLFLPFPKGAPRGQQEDLPSVQMVGLDTNDRAIIRDIEAIFGFYKELPNTPIAEGIEDVPGREMQEWMNDPAAADRIMATLRNKLIASLSYGNPDWKAIRESEVHLVLDAHLKTWL